MGPVAARGSLGAQPAPALQQAGVQPSAVTDVIITRVHWDHVDGADLFPTARIWIQRDEVDYLVDASGGVRNRAIDAPDAAMLHALRSSGRLAMVDGDAQDIIPGITVFTGGKHTYQSQYAAVRLAGATAVIASDNLYLFENIRAPRPHRADARCRVKRGGTGPNDHAGIVGASRGPGSRSPRVRTFRARVRGRGADQVTATP